MQQFLPAFTGIHQSRILLVQLVFLCEAVTLGQPTMLLLAFIGGFFWDAHCALGPHGGDPEVYSQQVESLRFGYSIFLFGGMGFLMQGIQPLFKQGKWQFSAVLSGIAIFLYQAAEYAIINFVRGDFVLSTATLKQMLFTSLLTMLFPPSSSGSCSASRKPVTTRSIPTLAANVGPYTDAWNPATDSGFTC